MQNLFLKYLAVSLPALLHSDEVSFAPHEHDAAGQCDAARPAKNLVRRPSRMARLGQPDCCTQHTASYSQENIQPFSLPLLHLFFHRVTFQNSQRGIVNIITSPIFCNMAALSTSTAVAYCASARKGVEAKASLCGQVARVGRGCVRLFLGLSCASAHASGFLTQPKNFEENWVTRIP